MNKVLALMFFLLISSLKINGQECLEFRAVHVGGNWGTNFTNITEAVPPDYPAEYFAWLNDLGANWVGLSVALHLDNSLDSIVKRKYDDVLIPTFTDEQLTRTIQEFRSRGLKVYLTLAFELFEAADSEYPVSRWQLGDPKIPQEDPSISTENWPWSPDHPLHESFVNSFFNSYTEQAMHFAALAEREGVEMFSLGTETDRLFRTRSGGYWPNHYLPFLKSMVEGVRQAFSGALTYDMHYGTLTAKSFFSPGQDSLWHDLALDVVGVSSYFELFEDQPEFIASKDTLELLWENIFEQYIIPLKNENPGKPILFLEFGYTNDIGAPFYHNSNVWESIDFQDNNSNGLEDGEEVQANLYESFFNTVFKYPDLVEGAFLWDNLIAGDEQVSWWNEVRHIGIRNRLAEEAVRAQYKVGVPAQLSPPSGETSVCQGPEVSTSYFVGSAQGLESLRWNITPGDAGTIVENGDSITVHWGDLFSGEVLISVAGKNACGQGAFSDPLSVNISVCTDVAKIVESTNIKVYPNPSSGTINISVEKQQNLQFDLVNLQGQVLFSGQITPSTTIEMEENGVYLLRIMGARSAEVIQIIIADH